jgi:CubicO group peptidase (beta-lactamase class C family)
MHMRLPLKLAVTATILGLGLMPAVAQRATKPAPAAATAPALPEVKPAAVGLSTERLQKMSAAFREEVKAGNIPGAIILIARKGRIAHFETIGELDPQTKAPMRKDAIFRIYSMTKPITSVAAMMLVEDGKLSLTDPVSKFVPAFKDVKVGVEKQGANGAPPSLELVAPRRPMTVQDLLRHTSGLTYGFFGSGLVKKAYVDSGIFGQDLTNEQFSNRLATLPLMHQPGSNWEYSQSTDVLGRVIEVASGKTLYAFMKERILDPLGMKDTAFFVANASDYPRIAEPFQNDLSFGVNANMSDPKKAVKYESGGGGMVSTATDYAKFLQMLLNKGSYGGRQYLSPATVAYMTSDHSQGIGLGSAYLPGEGYGFGLGFQVRRENGVAPLPGTAGDYSWGGAGGTAFWVDPKQDMFVVYMMQSPKQRVAMRIMLRNLVYGAIAK